MSKHFKKSKISPNWVTGFVDAEGCFGAHVCKNYKTKFGYQFQVGLTVTQHKQDKNFLEQLKDRLGCGYVVPGKGKKDPTGNCYQFRVRQLDDLISKVIPFFEKYPLQTKKKEQFNYFREVCFLLQQKVHLNPEGFQKCFELVSNCKSKNPNSALDSYPKQESLRQLSSIRNQVKQLNSVTKQIENKLQENTYSDPTLQKMQKEVQTLLEQVKQMKGQLRDSWKNLDNTK